MPDLVGNEVASSELLDCIKGVAYGTVKSLPQLIEEVNAELASFRSFVDKHPWHALQFSW